MKSVLIIGMGRFGRHLAEHMLNLGNEIMIVDIDQEIIESLASKFTDAQIGDCTNEDVLKSFDVESFDVCFVTICDNFQASLEITSLLKELGAKRVVSKARRETQEKFLLRNGADEVIFPEREMAEKLAIRYSANNIFDYIELTPELGIFEVPILTQWLGKSIAEINVRVNYNINILAIKNGTKMKASPSANYVFTINDHIVAMGTTKDIYKLTESN